MSRYRPPTFSQDLEDVLAGPLIHQLAAALDGVLPRRRRHTLAMHLGYAALQRSIGSANRLDAEFAARGVWQRAIDAHNRGAERYGDGHTLGRYLPPLTADTYRHARRALTDPDRLPEVQHTFTVLAIATADAVGLLPTTGGSLTHPIPERAIYGDGTIVRPLYRPDSPGRRDPDIDEHPRQDGTHWGNNFVFAYCRGPEPHRRIILGADRVHQPGHEADTAVALFWRIIDLATPRVQAVVYDGALRGVHHNRLMRDHGVVVVTKVHAAARRDGDKIVRTWPLGTRRHTVDGHECAHTIVTHDGALHESALDAAGRLILSDPLERKQLRRTRSRRNGYRLTVGVVVPCPRAPFVAWFTIHDRADKMRVIAETDPDFARLYGLRNDAESNNNSYKRTLPSRRAAALGWRRQLLDVLGWGLLVNSRAVGRYAEAAPDTSTMIEAG